MKKQPKPNLNICGFCKRPELDAGRLIEGVTLAICERCLDAPRKVTVEWQEPA
jgi:hypothetical protein